MYVRKVEGTYVCEESEGYLCILMETAALLTVVCLGLWKTTTIPGKTTEISI